MMNVLPILLIATAGAVSAQDIFDGLPENFLTPSVHITSGFGVSSTEIGSLGTHGHDPNRHFSLQGVDAGLSLRAHDYLQGFVNVNTFLDEEGELDAEWEEGFLKAENLPGGFEVRAGRYYNRLGLQNNVHLHGWKFVDSNFITTRFLGDDGLITEGGEVSWKLPVEFTSVISASYGRVPAEAHAEEEAPGPDEVDGENALFDSAFTARWLNRFGPDDFHQHQIGLNFANGENRFGETTSLYGLDYVYQWRENGLERGGRSFTFESEVLYRDAEYVSEDATVFGDADEVGAYLSGTYGFDENWSIGARYDYIQGLGDPLLESEERSRYSLALTRAVALPKDMSGHVRLQYNLDDIEAAELEHSVFLQLQLSWGEGEVR